MSGDKWGSLPYHRHGEGIDLVPGAPEGCIDPGANPRLVLAFDPDALATYVEGHVKAALTEAADQIEAHRSNVARKAREYRVLHDSGNYLGAAAHIVRNLADTG